MGQSIGILGAGQLGRMLALAGYPLGLRFQFYDPDPLSPSSHLAQFAACEYSDAEALDRFADRVDLITYEFENVPVTEARRLSQRKPVYPPPDALEVSQDRLFEKQFLRGLGVPTALFAAIDSRGDIAAACCETGLPAVLKTRRMGYDGKGQFIVRNLQELEQACAEAGGSGLILESLVSFQSELSLIAVRSVSGETRYYPLVENVHQRGILRRSRTPARGTSNQIQQHAENYADAILSSLNYVGVLTIEFFLLANDGALAVNEIAPRVHNSGHWTIEGADSSQFENHLRAILDLPLGSTRVRGHVGMLNIIGEMPDVARILGVQGAHLHLYGKSPRPNRKIGHVTVVAETEAELTNTLDALAFVR